MALFIGVMSGTSLDGLDVALVEISASDCQCLHAQTFPFPETLHSQLSALILAAPACDLANLLQADVFLAEFTASCITQLLEVAGKTPSQVAAIGFHGQTLYHLPSGAHPSSLQIGDANVLAERTNICTVADFRRRDIAAGGQGAPLVPAFHQAYFAHPTEHRVVLNVGGISNLTYLPANESPVLGFDTGPGNTLMDLWCERYFDQRYDAQGQLAADGAVIPALLSQMLADPYFALPAPKSTGREYFNVGWLEKQIAACPSAHMAAPIDVLTTLMVLTAKSIYQSIIPFSDDLSRLIVCGGGAHNPSLINTIQRTIPHVLVESSSAHGMHPDWVEAVAFAWLAAQRLSNSCGNLPTVTGAVGPRVLGTVAHA